MLAGGFLAEGGDGMDYCVSAVDVVLFDLNVLESTERDHDFFVVLSSNGIVVGSDVRVQHCEITRGLLTDLLSGEGSTGLESFEDSDLGLPEFPVDGSFCDGLLFGRGLFRSFLGGGFLDGSLRSGFRTLSHGNAP